MPTIIPDLSSVLPVGAPEALLIDRIVREGARQMPAAALQAEVDAYIEQFAEVRDEDGRRLKALAQIWNAENKKKARAAAKAFAALFGAKFSRPSRRSPMTWTSCSPSTTRGGKLSKISLAEHFDTLRTCFERLAEWDGDDIPAAVPRTGPRREPPAAPPPHRGLTARGQAESGQ